MVRLLTVGACESQGGKFPWFQCWGSLPHLGQCFSLCESGFLGLSGSTLPGAFGFFGSSAKLGGSSSQTNLLLGHFVLLPFSIALARVNSRSSQTSLEASLPVLHQCSNQSECHQGAIFPVHKSETKIFHKVVERFASLCVISVCALRCACFYFAVVRRLPICLELLLGLLLHLLPNRACCRFLGLVDLYMFRSIHR